MAIYSDKVNDSFKTKLKIFLFTKAFDGKILDYIKKDECEIIKEFHKFNLTLDIAKVYSSQYYQFDDDKEIVLEGKQLKSRELVSNLMDNQNYIISSTNIKTYLDNKYDKLKKEYKDDSLVIEEDEFNALIKQEQCSYCGISIGKINILGDNAKLHNKRSETRGYTLEIDRKEPNLEYTKDNCCMSCYWCNNAKTDEFTVSEFKEIARGINTVWKQRLKEAESAEEVTFPENSKIWDS